MKYETVTIRARGRMTIPYAIRQSLNLKPGERIVFIETKNGLILQSAEVAINQALSAIGKDLKRKGISLEQLIIEGRKIRSELIKEEYGITEKKVQ